MSEGIYGRRAVTVGKTAGRCDGEGGAMPEGIKEKGCNGGRAFGSFVPFHRATQYAGAAAGKTELF